MKILFFILVLACVENFSALEEEYMEDEPEDNEIFNEEDYEEPSDYEADHEHSHDDDDDDGQHIVGGQSTPIHVAPYQIQLQDDTHFTLCGGSIIHPKWILTAAHCFDQMRFPDAATILTGSNLRNHGDRFEIKRKIIHEDYLSAENGNDIALLELKKPIPFNKVQKKIELSDKPVSDKDTVFISGFGKLSTHGSMSKDLQSATTVVIDHKACEKAYKNKGITITEGMICSGNEKTDTCTGDSGGPAVVRDKQVGVTSFGVDCAHEKYPGVYTSVAYMLPWIREKTGLPHLGTNLKPVDE